MGSGLSDSVGAGMGPLTSYALAAVVVLVLVVGVLLLAKRVMGAGPVGTNAKRGPRLAVLDVTAIDQRRKLVLVRRDEVEHLVLIGGQNDLVVEKGILRTPPSLRQPSIDPIEGRSEAIPAIAPSPVAPLRPPVAVPQPRHAAGTSPLRRQVPRPEPRHDEGARRMVPVRDDHDEPAAPEGDEPVRDEAPFIPAAPVLPVEPVTPPRRPEPPVLPLVAPVTLAPQRSPEPEIAAPEPARPARTREAETSEPKIPAFLRRSDPPRPAAPAEPEPQELPVAAPPPRMAPPAPFAFAPVVPPLPEPREEPAAPPLPEPFEVPRVGPASDIPDASKPLPVAPPVDDMEDKAEPQPRALQAIVPPVSEETDKRPLAVRSFATAIQSRRTNFEPSRGVPSAPERPSPSIPQAPVPPAVQPPVPPVMPAAVPAVPLPPSPERPQALRPQELSLEEELSQKLNSNFDSLDWPEEEVPTAPPVRQSEPVSTPPQTMPAAAPLQPVQQVVQAKAPERPLTLEEEMERLLNDFDLGERRP
ncbi:flagellar biosynthetic protein FliO [Aureimonas psammosilenae]|uniref:flagellar biosynthetic protein FliO n=1 Tax=Aureimonas psammosilenae TaxID=2495496 RepID=UPI0012607829|nr:flagellar biosynthetic protein FliO [Aureimonas psammosilenae]